jgi:ppGpp synthetase/RelA/SpoT-type nucleotidyltranferase
VIEEYDQQRALYSDYASTLHKLMGLLLAAENFRPPIQQRVKDRTSLARKVLSNPQYSSLTDISDVAGIRIITYYADEVDWVASIIKKEFEAIKVTDKRAEHGLSEFGYRALHCAVRLKTPRSELLEYRRFAGLTAEIQICSILEHTWAEIEHDLGYKSSVLVPAQIQRNLIQLAGVVENADQQFQKLRDELKEHGRTVPWKTARAEGITELIGDFTFEIGRKWLPAGAEPSLWDLVLFFNTNVTNRVAPGMVTEVVALLEGTSTSGHGIMSSVGGLRFPHALLEETLEQGACRIRIANVRVNACQHGSGGQITATLAAISSKTGDRVVLGEREFARFCSALEFSVSSNGGILPLEFPRAAGINSELAANAEAEAVIINFELCYREAFGGAFRTDLQEAGDAERSVDSGTRLIATFEGVPDNVGVYVTARELAGDQSHCKARLIRSDRYGNSAPPAIPDMAVTATSLKGTQQSVQIALIDKYDRPTAVWEWVDGNPNRKTPEEVRFGLIVVAKPGAAGAGTVKIKGSLAPSGGPLASIPTADSIAPIPRFCPSGFSVEAFSFTD